jgi:hypothetical protein
MFSQMMFLDKKMKNLTWISMVTFQIFMKSITCVP